MIPDVALGAIAAALIAALISLVSLIVAKESKLSEFRQAWIDSLRSELSIYLTNVNAVSDARLVNFKDNKERFERLQPLYSKLNEMYYLIALRLNTNEDQSSQLKDCMVKLSKAIHSSENMDNNIFDHDRINFINISNNLLKNEWEIVKAGEPVYRTTRWIAGTFVVVLIAIAIALSLSRIEASAPHPKTRTSTIGTATTSLQSSREIPKKPQDSTSSSTSIESGIALTPPPSAAPR